VPKIEERFALAKPHNLFRLSRVIGELDSENW